MALVATRDLAVQSSAQQCIDDHLAGQHRRRVPFFAAHPGLAGQLGGAKGVILELIQRFERNTLHLESRLHRQRRQHVTIAAVIAASTEHRHAACLGPARAKAMPGAGRRALHQRETINAPGNRAPIELAHLSRFIKRA